MVAANVERESSEKKRRPGASEKQVAANRANAKNSTGPRTQAGKDASRMNAVRHGLCATLAVFPSENGPSFDAFARGIVASLKPRDHAEAVLVDQYSSIAWKLSRLALAEQDIGETSDTPLIGRILARELKAGRGPMLQLMSLEDRLRGALTKTVRQIKELRALRRSIDEEDADDGLNLNAAPAGRTENEVRSEKKGDDPDVEAVVDTQPAADPGVGAAADGEDEKVQNEPNLDASASAQTVSLPDVGDEPVSVRNEPNLVAADARKQTEEEYGAECRRRFGC